MKLYTLLISSVARISHNGKQLFIFYIYNMSGFIAMLGIELFYHFTREHLMFIKKSKLLITFLTPNYKLTLTVELTLLLLFSHIFNFCSSRQQFMLFLCVFVSSKSAVPLRSFCETHSITFMLRSRIFAFAVGRQLLRFLIAVINIRNHDYHFIKNKWNETILVDGVCELSGLAN